MLSIDCGLEIVRHENASEMTRSAGYLLDIAEKQFDRKDLSTVTH